MLQMTITVLLGLIPIRGVLALIPNDVFYSRQWYLDKIGAPAAWDITTGNPKSVIAVIDIGVDIDHPDLKDAIWTNPDEIPGNGIDDDNNGYVDDVHGWDFIGNDNDPSPVYDVPNSDTRDLHHGTVVAGIIAARGNNGEGIAGIDWHAKIMPLRVLHGDGSGDVDTVLSAMRYAMREGATIINLSFVGDERSTELDDLIAEAAAKGLVITAAGGNEDKAGKGDLDRFPVYPICAGLDGGLVLGVAATNQRDEKASFSSYGRCVDIAAPGEQIIGTLYHNPSQVIVRLGTGAVTAFTQLYGGYFNGTSFAAPMAAGAVSLLRGLLPRATPADIIGLLQRTADSVQGENHITAGKIGAGRLNLARAVEEANNQVAAVPSATATVIAVSAPLASVGEAVAVRVEVRNERGSPLIGRAVAVSSNRPSDILSPSSAATDAQGVATLAVRGMSEGIAELQVAIDGAVVGHVRAVFARALDRPIGSGSLLRGSAATVYVISSDGKRYAFPDAATFRSWYADANGVQRVPDAILSAFPLGGLIAIRPGTFLVKIQTDPKTYAVEGEHPNAPNTDPNAPNRKSQGVLRWVPSEETAAALYGDAWAKRVVDVPDAFFTTYRVGEPVNASAHPNGTLLEDGRDGQRYYIANGQRRRIDSTLAFLKNGFQWRDIVKAPAVAYPDGAPIVEREPTLASPVL